VRGLSLLLLLLAAGPPEQQRNDAGPAPVDPPAQRSEEDQEVIRNLELLEHLAESQTLDLLLELDAGAPDKGGD
jgi:hypothetical protein